MAMQSRLAFPSSLSAIYHQSEKHYSFSFPVSSVSCDRNSKKTLSTHSTNYPQKRKKKSLPLKERTEANRAMSLHLSPQLFIMVSLFIVRGVSGATFTFKNNCQYAVWPGILSSAGHPNLDSTGFELPKSSSRSFEAPPGWSGRFWGRTGCNFDANGQGSCTTGDCGSGQVECNGAGATPPATLAEFTLGSDSTTQDFYDVSLVDGYNLPMVVIARQSGSSKCPATGCVVDINLRCPTELRAENGDACRSACEAFGKPEFCCSGDYSTPNTCRPSEYSEMFKTACPRSYSYAYDDATSTFTCTGADYEITFCPTLERHKSSKGSPRTGPSGVMLADDLYLEDLAAADAGRVSLSYKIAFTVGIILMAFLLL